MMINLRAVRVLLAVVAASAAFGGEVARAQSAVSESQLEVFLGLNQGDLTGLNNGPVVAGSAIMQSITVSAGATLSFDYDFLTNQPPPATNLLSALDPFAFVTQPALTDFADNYYNYPTPMPSAPAQTGFMYNTGYNSFTETFSMAGTYTLGIGVASVTDNTLTSGLLLDNFQLSGGSLVNGSFGTGDFTGWSTIGTTSIVTSNFGISPTNGPYQAFLSTSTVPEPSSTVLLVLGGLGVTVAVRSRKPRTCLRSSTP
jgi:hypothetical protein